MTQTEESELIQKAKTDPHAFGILYEQNYARIFGYVYRRTLNWETAQDITSEVFIKAFKNIRRFRWTNISISAWFYRIATNETNMYFRKGRYVSVSLEALMERNGFDPPDPQTTAKERSRIERELRQYEDFLLIRSKIKELPVKYQEVITLRYFEQKSIREIAEILGKREGTIKSLLSRGIEKMKNLL
jgi:RNA polymerase sigma-70 factor (ECF subfamily)